jgi:DNA processing protein
VPTRHDRAGITRAGGGAAGGTPLRCLRPSDDEFPALLRASAEAPDTLWVRGALRVEDTLAVAIVGSRRATPYGIGMAEAIASGLARRGVTVISGLARGIDSAAHRGALRGGGRTLAVLGCGVDVVYPPEHRRLGEEIVGAGALLSQFAPGTPPLPHHFPVRNRVIAGLALGVVVVEAAEKSGALVTAGAAGDLGREVMGVPGRATSPESRGVHELLRDGAALVESADDVLAALPRAWRDCLVPPERAGATGERARRRGLGADGETTRVLEIIGAEAASIDEIIARSRLDPGRAAALLMRLELEGHVRPLDGKRYARAASA